MRRSFLFQRAFKVTIDISIVVLTALHFCNTAIAARFPNAIEKRVVLNGQDAIEVAKLIGLPVNIQSNLKLQLGRSDSWAVYLLKDDSPKKLLNDNDGMPDRFNTIEFSPSPTPSISINSFWLDQGTALPNRKPGIYSFSSTWLSSSNIERNSWGTLISAMKKINSNSSSNTILQSERKFHFIDGEELTFQLWINSQNELSLSILVQHLPS